MKKNERHLSLRIDKDLLKKFDYVAKYDDRSMNWLLLSLVRKCVGEFEESHGTIPLSEQKE
ncbi:MAG: hypothetical protein PHN93_00420 [Sphaerochaetaceae bacterium]|mgnify:FL=1|jgi:hypothetical protein|nr:hypothetical protein [Sphaerochaetaceae bacterium]MEA4911353.1 hypothetical protein [Oscillospiraceae bacterium]